MLLSRDMMSPLKTLSRDTNIIFPHQHGHAPLRPDPGDVVLRVVGPLVGLLQLLLGLAELGQVQRSDLLGVLNLLLVAGNESELFIIAIFLQ